MEKEKICEICGKLATVKIKESGLTIYYCDNCVKPMINLGFKSIPIK